LISSLNNTLFLSFYFLFILRFKLSECFFHVLILSINKITLLLELKCIFFNNLFFAILIFEILLFSFKVINFTNKLFILTHDTLIISLMKIDGFFEFFL